MRTSHVRWLTSLFLVTAACAACGSDDDAVVRANKRSLATETIDATSGGRVESHNVKLDVPGGALKTDTAITLAAFDVTDASSVGLPPSVHVIDGIGFSVGFTESTFNQPIAMTINFDETIGGPASTSATYAYEPQKILVVYRAEIGTNGWQAASASLSQFRPMRASIEHPRDIIPALVDVSCMPDSVCTPNANGIGESCAILLNGVGARCEQRDASQFNIECRCEGTDDVVLQTTSIPKDSANAPLFKGLAMICGVPAPSTAGCGGKLTP